MIPLTISNCVTVVAVDRDHAHASTRCSRCSRSAAAARSTSWPSASDPPAPGGAWASSTSRPSWPRWSRRRVAGVRVVKGFGAERVQAHRLAGRGRRLSTTVDGRRRGSGPRSCPRSTLLPNLGLIAGAALRRPPGARRPPQRSATLVAFNVYVVMLIWPLRMLGHDHRPGPAGRRRRPSGSHEVLATDPAIVDPPRPVPLPERSRSRCASRTCRFGYRGTAASGARRASTSSIAAGRVGRARRAPPAAARPPSPG